MEIKKINETNFREYGKIIYTYDASTLINELIHTPLTEQVAYIPSDEKLENTEFAKNAQSFIYGGLPIQVGYCNGKNSILNAVEYHRDSEVNVPADDIVVIVGKQQDIVNEDGKYTYDTKNMEAFLIPKGTVLEFYATTLHYAPCGHKGNAFRCAVILPKNTNTDLDAKNQKNGQNGEEALLFAKNKWLIAHEEAKIDGAYVGLKGENLSI